MRFPGPRRLGPFVLGFAVFASASLLFAVSPAVRAACGTASSPCPTPTPTPVNAFLSLDVTQGGPSTVINVTGGQFLPNETMTLYWDTPGHVAGSATADGGGSFNTRVKPFAGDKDGVHRLCASVPPNPCANFALLSATPSPETSPSPPATPLASPSPGESPSEFASPARITATLNGLDVISRPPFVFLPIFAAGAILLSLGWWVINVARRPRRPGLLPSAAVVHRATRPDYSAAFGAPPPTPRSSPEPSAWNEPMRHVTPTPPAASSGAPADPSGVSPNRRRRTSRRYRSQAINRLGSEPNLRFGSWRSSKSAS
jgi:hypothetical protein